MQVLLSVSEGEQATRKVLLSKIIFFFAETLASQIEAQLIFPILRQKKNLNMEVYSKEIANLSMPIPLDRGRKALDIQTTQVAIYPETTAANI